LNGVRVGVVADTHCPEFIAHLPERVHELLAGVDAILHAGDVGGAEGLRTLAELERIAPVEAVRGDHDRMLPLPPARSLSIAGRRVVVVHGNRTRAIEEPVTLMGTLSLGLLWPAAGLDAWLRRRFPDADVIVYGHTHAPRIARGDGALLFNPGAVYQVTPERARQRLAGGPGWFEWSWLQVMRHRRRWPPPSVGILTFGEGRVDAQILPL
jgi:uncharacterized protein